MRKASKTGVARTPYAVLGWCSVAGAEVRPGPDALADAIQRLDEPLFVVATDEGPAVARGAHAGIGSDEVPDDALPLLAFVPPLTPDRLGDATFLADHGVRVACVAGAMAHGISSVELVAEMARAGMLGEYGAAGQPTERIAQAVDRLRAEVGDLPWAVNLIHSPQEPRQEWETVDLLLDRGVHVASASAFLRLTPMIAAYRLHGIARGPDGRVAVPNRVLAKVSREEVAAAFLSPAPERVLRELVERGRLTPAQAALAARVPMCDDLTAEGDSGGHTDSQPANVLLPLVMGLRDRLCGEYGYEKPVRVGAAGGLSTPSAIAGAFAAGAAYVVTGTVNQACAESGTSDMARQLLAEAGMADVALAPAPDMFESGARVQVLKRGTLFPMRAEWLYDLYRRFGSLEAIPPTDRKRLEEDVLRAPIAQVWADCVAFFSARDPAQIERAESDPKHRMALVFRWYLGRSSRWAIAGDASRRLDAQIWCGPAIGSFNEWTRGTVLADPAERKVATVSANLMAGAAALTRARWLSAQGIDPGPAGSAWLPRLAL